MKLMNAAASNAGASIRGLLERNIEVRMMLLSRNPTEARRIFERNIKIRRIEAQIQNL